jgi:predicted GNAT family acetyltransferase
MAAGPWTRFRPAGARELGRGAADIVARVLAEDPVAGCMVAARFEAAGMDQPRLGGRFWGVDKGRGALCFAGPNVIPLAGDADAMGVLASALARQRRYCASLVGRAEMTLPLWQGLADVWGPAREVRPDQPLMVCPDTPPVAADPRVAPVPRRRFDRYFPAAVAMFREEVGADPTVGDGGRGYRARVTELVSAGRAMAVFDGDAVIYKAEIGALSRRVALIQGVWVHPEWRGRGLAAPATAAVVRAVHRLGRLPSLYVNAHNAPARATYARLGFRRAGTFASVLF